MSYASKVFQLMDETQKSQLGMSEALAESMVLQPAKKTQVNEFLDTLDRVQRPKLEANLQEFDNDQFKLHEKFVQRVKDQVASLEDDFLAIRDQVLKRVDGLIIQEFSDQIGQGEVSSILDEASRIPKLRVEIHTPNLHRFAEIDPLKNANEKDLSVADPIETRIVASHISPWHHTDISFWVSLLNGLQVISNNLDVSDSDLISEIKGGVRHALSQ